MAVLSAKVSTEVAEQFRQAAKENDMTPSGLLAHLATVVARWRRFEIFDPAVGEPAGWVYLSPTWDFAADPTRPETLE